VRGPPHVPDPLNAAVVAAAYVTVGKANRPLPPGLHLQPPLAVRRSAVPATPA